MPNGYLAELSEDRKQELFADLNYLNLSEIKSFCKRHSIPYRIALETADGKRSLTREDDRKGVVLERIRTFLETGAVPGGTCFPAAVVCSKPIQEPLSASGRLYYGHYDKTNRAMNNLLQNLTAGEFRSGATARILAREFWSRGLAPTFAEFAAAWMQAAKDHKNPHPEWAFLSDRARRGNVQNWKQLRAQKASKVLDLLNRLVHASQD